MGALSKSADAQAPRSPKLCSFSVGELHTGDFCGEGPGWWCWWWWWSPQP